MNEHRVGTQEEWQAAGDELAKDEQEVGAVLEETRRLMNQAVVSGRQPRSIYRRAGRPCPRCGAALRSRGQGDDNRTTYWCEGCQS